jgi:hypothetical protein
MLARPPPIRSRMTGAEPDLAVEDDREPPTDVLRGDVLEDLTASRLELERRVRLVELVHRHRRVVDVVAGEDDLVVHDDGLGAHAALLRPLLPGGASLYSNISRSVFGIRPVSIIQLESVVSSRTPPA